MTLHSYPMHLELNMALLLCQEHSRVAIKTNEDISDAIVNVGQKNDQ